MFVARRGTTVAREQTLADAGPFPYRICGGKGLIRAFQHGIARDHRNRDVEVFIRHFVVLETVCPRPSPQ